MDHVCHVHDCQRIFVVTKTDMAALQVIRIVLGLYSIRGFETYYRQIVSKPREYLIVLKFDSTAVEVPVKLQSDWKSLNPNDAASRLHFVTDCTGV